jgi:hypothetical protein
MAGAPAARPRIVSQVKAGEELGISRQRVQKLLKRWPEVIVDDGVDIEKLKALREENADPLRQAVYQQSRKLKAVEVEAPKAAVPAPAAENQPELPLDALDFNAARTRRERANAELAQMKADQEAGRLISRQEVQAREFAIARQLRDRLTGFPARVQQFLPPEAMQMLTKEVRALIDDLQKDAERIAKEEF